MRTRLLTLVFVLVPILAAAQNTLPLDGTSRIRSSDKRLLGILNDGAERSPTLRAIVEKVEGSDVVVYLESEVYIQRMLLGSITWIGASGNLRFLRATIKLRPKSSGLIATLAHELQHVVEVIDAPWVTSDQSLRDLYMQIGQRSGMSDKVWDTQAAQRTTWQVTRELNGVAADADDER